MEQSTEVACIKLYRHEPENSHIEYVQIAACRCVHALDVHTRPDCCHSCELYSDCFSKLRPGSSSIYISNTLGLGPPLLHTLGCHLQIPSLFHVLRLMGPTFLVTGILSLTVALSCHVGATHQMLLSRCCSRCSTFPGAKPSDAELECLRPFVSSKCGSLA